MNSKFVLSHSAKFKHRVIILWSIITIPISTILLLQEPSWEEGLISLLFISFSVWSNYDAYRTWTVWVLDDKIFLENLFRKKVLPLQDFIKVDSERRGTVNRMYFVRFESYLYMTKGSDLIMLIGSSDKTSIAKWHTRLLLEWKSKLAQS